jgi:hypothetical protein
VQPEAPQPLRCSEPLPVHPDPSTLPPSRARSVPSWADQCSHAGTCPALDSPHPAHARADVGLSAHAPTRARHAPIPVRLASHASPSRPHAHRPHSRTDARETARAPTPAGPARACTHAPTRARPRMRAHPGRTRQPSPLANTSRAPRAHPLTLASRTRPARTAGAPVNSRLSHTPHPPPPFPLARAAPPRKWDPAHLAHTLRLAPSRANPSSPPARTADRLRAPGSPSTPQPCPRPRIAVDPGAHKPAHGRPQRSRSLCRTGAGSTPASTPDLPRRSAPRFTWNHRASRHAGAPVV